MLSRWFTELFFPHTCCMCGNKLIVGKVLCDECLLSLPRTEQFLLRGNSTEEFFASEPRFEEAAAFLFFDKESPIQQVVHAFKYREQPQLAYHLATIAAQEFLETDFFETIDVIIPVPLHSKRFRTRGYNQSEYIARGLGDVTGIPVDTTHVCRVVNNSQQALLPKQHRDQNVAGIFQVNHPEEMYRKHILLVDDLITTGATIRSMMDAMKPFRGSKYSVFALCRPR